MKLGVREVAEVRGSLGLPRKARMARPLGVCLGRVKRVPLLSRRRRESLKYGDTSKSRSTEEGLRRKGLHLIMSLTGRCAKEKVALVSLVRRKGVNLVRTTRGCSCAGRGQFSACTS